MKNLITIFILLLTCNLISAQELCCKPTILEGWYYEQASKQDTTEFFVHTQIHLKNENFKIIDVSNKNIIFYGKYIRGKIVIDKKGNKWKYKWKVTDDLKYYLFRLKSKKELYTFRFFIESDKDIHIKFDKS